MVDTLDVDADRQRGFAGTANNQLRIYWLLNPLVQDRFERPDRERIYRSALETASLDWALDFAESCLADYAPRDNARLRDNPRVSEEVAREFQQTALDKLRAAAADGSFTTSAKIISILFAWWRLNGNDAGEIQAWTTEHLADDAFVIGLATHIPSESWSFGMGWDEMGDRVQRRMLRVNLAPFADILDTALLDARVAELLASNELDEPTRAILTLYRDTPRGDHRDGPVVEADSDEEGDGSSEA